VRLRPAPSPVGVVQPLHDVFFGGKNFLHHRVCGERVEDHPPDVRVVGRCVNPRDNAGAQGRRVGLRVEKQPAIAAQV